MVSQLLTVQVILVYALAQILYSHPVILIDEAALIHDTEIILDSYDVDNAFQVKSVNVNASGVVSIVGANRVK